MYSRTGQELRVLLAHPGGPYFAKKQDGAWGIPKGEFEGDESPVDAARREFFEETGFKVDVSSGFLELGSIVQRGGKTVYAWAFEGEWEPDRKAVSNTCFVQWPPDSDQWIEVPEIDDAGLFPLGVAKRLMRAEQWPLVERLLEQIG
jgi:predicted NUDIX family NTP pyrophosphohydrolase